MEHTDTLSQLALVLAIVFAGEAVLRRLRQPALIAYIFAGFVLGPHVLGVIHDQAEITFLAELGILLLLFVVGLELDLRNFISVYKVAVITTLLQIAGGLCAAGLIGLIFDWPLVRILLIAFAMSLSSTAVAIKLLENLGGMNAPSGRTAIGILVAQDLAIIPMLLIIGSFAQGSFNPWSLLKIGAAIGVMGGLMYALTSKMISFNLPAWLQPSQTPPDSQSVIKALAYCFSAAAFSGALGLSASYGAFLAGLVLGSTQDRDQLEIQVRPVFDMLMMVFFLSVGILLDFEFIFSNFTEIFLTLLVIMIVKTTLNVWTLRFLGVERRNALVMGTLLGQIGEFSFVLAALGLSVGAIEDDGYKFVVTLIALSLAATPAWLYGVRRLPLLKRHIRRKLMPVIFSKPARSAA